MRSSHKPRFLSLLLVAALLATALSPAASAAGNSLLTGFKGTQFIFSDSGIQVIEGDETNYSIDGTALSITGPGNYALSGKCADGSVTVKKGVTDVQLTLAGLDLTSASTAPIVCAKGSHVTIYVAGGTENTLTDAAINNDDNYPDNKDAENAVLKCKDGTQVSIGGTGTLNIVANGKNGIKSGMTTDTEGEAWMEITNLTLNITAAVNDAINAEQKLNVMSGVITINAADDAIHCDRALNIGALNTDGPTIRVEKCYEGLEGADLAIYSGNITIHAEDDGLNAANSDLENYPFTLTIAGGTVYVDTTAGDGIDSNGTLTISGGNVQIYGTSNRDNAPLDADGAFTITGGTVLAVGAGSMAQEPSQKQAFVSFGSRGGFGGGRPGTGFKGDADRFRPDGQTPPKLPDDQQPADGQTPPELPDGFKRGDRPDGAEPPQGLEGQDTSGDLSIAAGDVITVRDEAGNTLATGKALRGANYVFFSSSEVTDGETYALYVNGEKAADGTAATQGASGFGGGMIRNEFQDVTRANWFYDAVSFVRGRGLMTGVSATAFDPQGATTRSMIWTILARLSGVDTSGGETWYAKGQAWAMENDISDGTAPARSISREELVTMLYRYAQKFGSAEPASDDTLDFPDVGLVHGWATESFEWAVSKGVIAGKSGKLAPQDTATRAEVATILQRYCQL